MSNLSRLKNEQKLTKANLALETAVLTHFIATLTLVVLRLEHLAARLMLKLIVFAEEAIAEGASIDTSTVRVGVPLTF